MAAAKIKGHQAKHRSSRRRKQERHQRRCQTRCKAGHPKRRKRKPNKKLYYAKSRFSLKRLNKILNCEPTTHRLSIKVNMNRQRMADMKVQGNRQQYQH